jgi:hypothetical protein
MQSATPALLLMRACGKRSRTAQRFHWGATRGKAALDQLATQDEARSRQEAWPWVVMNREAHPEWGEIHLHALLADFLTALTLWRIGALLAEQMESFQAGETMGRSG